MNRLKEASCAIHFETNNCYFQLPRSSKRIPFEEEGGLFVITATKGYAEDKPYRPVHACSVKSQDTGEANVNIATSGDLGLWHRRMRHMTKRDLLNGYEQARIATMRNSHKPTAGQGFDW